MQSTKYHHGDDYCDKKLINTKQYLDQCYKSPFLQASDDFPPFPQNVIKHMHNVFEKVKPPGGSQLDFGCGPCIHTLLSSTRWCNDVVCAEFSPLLRNEVTKWVDRSPDAFDWSHAFKYVAELEGSKENAIEDRIRAAVKKVIPCNIFNNNMLEPETFPPFDVITSSLCIEAACMDLATYNSVIKKLYNMLAPGGVLVLIGMLDQQWYDVGPVRFHSLSISKENIDKCLAEAGFVPAEWQIVHLKKNAALYDASGYFTLHAIKPQ